MPPRQPNPSCDDHASARADDGTGLLLRRLAARWTAAQYFRGREHQASRIRPDASGPNPRAEPFGGAAMTVHSNPWKRARIYVAIGAVGLGALACVTPPLET